MSSSICTLEVMFFVGSNSDVDLLSTLPFLLDAKLGRTSAPLTERSVVLVISPLVSLMVNQVVHFHFRSVAILVSGYSPCGPIDCFSIKFTSESTHASTVDPRPRNQHKKAWGRG